MTEILPTDTPDAMRQAIDRAVAVLASGDVVAMPTETVYGLAAEALSEGALEKIFEAKGRPTSDPLIIHLPTKDYLDEVCILPDDEEVAETIREMVAQLWPGPLTLLLPKRPCVPDLATAGLPTVAVRMSSHAVFRKVITALDRPLAAPSANLFGQITATSATAVMDELGGRIPLILDAGASHHGIESTIVKVVPGKKKPDIIVLRPGALTKEDLRPFGKVYFEHDTYTGGGPKRYIPRTPRPDPGAPKPTPKAVEAPGMLESHYAPKTPLRVLSDPSDFQPEDGKSYALISYRGVVDDGYCELHEWDELMILSPGSGKMPEAAVRFYYVLREADLSGVDEIIAEPIPERAQGVALLDRLRRAAADSGSANSE